MSEKADALRAKAQYIADSYALQGTQCHADLVAAIYAALVEVAQAQRGANVTAAGIRVQAREIRRLTGEVEKALARIKELERELARRDA